MTKHKFYQRVLKCEFEYWKPITNYEDYVVSNYGRVKSYRGGSNGLIMKFTLRNKYLSVALCNDNGAKRFSVHRLVALTFLEQEEGKDIVNHIDCNRENNYVNNLEFCTISHNTQHAYDNGLIETTQLMRETRRKNIRKCIDSNRKKVICINDGIIFKSVKEVSEYYHIGADSVVRICKHKCKATRQGLKFEYYED